MRFRHLSIYLSIIVAASSQASAAHFMPIVTAFTTRDYKGEAQNWQCTQDDAGVMYFANNAGIMSFDGYTWDCQSIPGYSVIRSVRSEGDRIYVGAFEQFGYFTKNDLGSFSYTSLSDSVRNYTIENEDVWNIVRCGERLYFQTFKSIFAYDGQKADILPLPANLRPLYLFSSGGILYAQMVDDGFYSYDKGVWKCLFSRSELADADVISVNALSGVSGLLLVSEYAGIFRYESGSLSKFPTDIDQVLVSAGVNRVTNTANGLLWIGTLQNGLYVIDKHGSHVMHFDSAHGLPNNSVLGLYTDKNDNVWVMLDDGIGLIHNGFPVDMLTLDKNEPALGMVYSIGKPGGDLCIATNNGFYQYSEASSTITENPLLKGQNWDISTYDGTTFIANNRITLIRDWRGREYVYPDNSTGIVRGHVNGHDVLVQSSYLSLRVFQKNLQGLWELTDTVAGFGAPLRQTVIDNDGTIWGVHFNKGILKIRLSHDLKRASTKTFSTVGSPSNRRNYGVMRICGRTVFTDGDSLYTFDEVTERFRSDHPINEDLPSIKNICSATAVNDTAAWLSTIDAYYLVSFYKGHFQLELSIPLKLFPKSNNYTNGKVYVDNDGVSYLHLNGTVAKVRIADFYDKGSAAPSMHLSKIESYAANGFQPVTLADATNGLLSGVVRFTFSYPNYENSASFEFCLIRGDDVLVNTSNTAPTVTFHNLKSGNYKLIAKAKDYIRGDSNIIAVEFKVPSPWYLRWWAWGSYLIAAVAIIWIITQVRVKWKLRRQKAVFEIKEVEKQKMLMEQEKIIAEQRARLLESELTAKGKELASMALNVSSKQQVIDSLKESLNDRRRQGGKDTKLAAEMLRKIESNQTNSREFWSVFEQNFDLIHEHFFRNLRASFPALTPSDLKFCALLRLNLSTKEIADFANLTVRGVEAARYRLRKKFNLAEKQSLVQFLIDYMPDDDTMRADSDSE